MLGAGELFFCQDTGSGCQGGPQGNLHGVPPRGAPKGAPKETPKGPLGDPLGDPQGGAQGSSQGGSQDGPQGGSQGHPMSTFWPKTSILRSPRRCRCQIQNLRTKCCRMVVSTSRLEPAECLLRPVEDLAQRPQFCRARGGVGARFGICGQNAAEWWCRRLDWSPLKAFCSHANTCMNQRVSGVSEKVSMPDSESTDKMLQNGGVDVSIGAR